MVLLRNHISIKASSLLESVMALAIISICVYMSITYSNLFFLSKNENTKSWEEKEMNNLFYELNVNQKTEIPEKYKTSTSDTVLLKNIYIELQKEDKIILNKTYYLNEN